MSLMPSRLLTLVLASACAAACSKTETAQARGRDDAPKPVKVERVREEAVHRSVDIVGTLSAVDEVTVSSEAEGRVSKLLADLGDRVHAGQALLELDREKLQYAAERQLRDAEIRAPFDGYIQKRLVSLGEYVKVQTPVMSVVRVNPLKVTAEIPERMAPWIKIGQSVELHVDAYPDKTITGKVSRI